jgi:hypothetical protein
MSLTKYKNKKTLPVFYNIANFENVLLIQTLDVNLVKKTDQYNEYTVFHLKEDCGSQKLKIFAKVFWDYDPSVGWMYTNEWADGEDNLNNRKVIKDNKGNLYLCGPT